MLLSSLLISPPAHGAGNAAASGCTDVTWLDPSSPPPFLTDIDQAPGSGFCQFQEFSNWNFMSLVLGANPAFESWPTTEQVYPAQGPPICSGAPLGSAVTPIIRQNGAAVMKLVSAARAKRGVSAAEEGAPVQATGQPLVDRDGRYIQYEMRVNPTLCATISSCQLQLQACGTAAATAAPEFRWPSGVSYSTAPGNGIPGAAELKLSWRVMETCNLPDSPSPCTPTDLSEFFWIGPVKVDSLGPNSQGPAMVTLGLTGFHLAQKTPTRPEMLWATWEHVSNDPVCPGSDNSVCQDPSHASTGVSTPSGWNLFDASVNPPPLVNTPPRCPDPANFGKPPTQANCLNQPYYTATTPQTQPDTEVCRLAPCGGGEENDIADLNEAMRSKLGSNVWANYFFVGSVWGKNAMPTGPSDSVGSPWLANSTMETYFQTISSSQNQFNCFTCHQSAPTGGYTADPPDINLDFVHSLQRASQTTPSTCPIDINSCVPTLTAHKAASRP
jgi:hypothetical protein